MDKRYGFKVSALLVAAMVMFAATGFSQDKKQELFPPMDGWELQIGDQVYNSGNLWNIINGAADAYLSYDFQKLYTAEYLKGQDRRIKVYIFEHSNPVNAFGIYSQERSSDYTFVNTGAQGFKSGDAYYFITGPYYVQISTNDTGLNDAMDALAAKIDQQFGHNDALPATLKRFPEKGLVRNSEKYIAANFLGYSYMRSAFTANYQRDGKDFRVFIVQPQDAESVNSMLESYLEFVDYPKPEDTGGIFKVEDPYNGDVMLYKGEDYLAGVMGAGESLSKEYLRQIIDKEQ
jgi:hypothetical protein